MQRGSKRCSQSYAGCASEVRIMRAWTYHFLRYKPLHEASYFPILINLGSLNWTHVIHAHDHDQFMIMIIIHIKHMVTGKVGKFSRQIGIKSRRWQNLTWNYLYMPVVTGHAWSEFCSDLHAVFFVGKPKKFSTSTLQYNDIYLMDPPSFYKWNNVYTGFFYKK